jgi:hypothetical protein
MVRCNKSAAATACVRRFGPLQRLLPFDSRRHLKITI